MGLRFNNTYIVEKMEYLPFSELQVTNQVLLFEKKWNNDVCKFLDKIFNCAVSEIRHGCLYVFDCNESNARPWIDEDTKWTDEQQEQIDDMYAKDDSQGLIKTIVRGCEVNTERQNVEKAYFLMNDRIFEMGNKEEFIENFRDFEIDFEGSNQRYYNSSHLYEQDMLKRIHRSTFEWGSNYTDNFRKFAEEHYQCEYLSIPINRQYSFDRSDHCIIVAIRHEIDTEKMEWLTHKDVYLMSVNGKCTQLRCKFEAFYEFLKETKRIGKDTAAKFDKSIEVASYDTEQFIEDRGSKLYSVCNHFDYPLRSSHIEKFYQPIYSVSELELKAYANTVRWYTSGTRFTKANKPISTYEMRDTSELYEHYLVGESLNKFLCHKQTGLNPKDGVFYKNRTEVNEEIEKRVIYRDDEGIIYKDEYQKVKYFVKLHGYFVSAEEGNEKLTVHIEAVNDRKAMVDRLMRAK